MHGLCWLPKALGFVDCVPGLIWLHSRPFDLFLTYYSLKTLVPIFAVQQLGKRPYVYGPDPSG